MKELSIAFIGAGKMATAIAAGLAKNTTGLKVRAYDVSPAAAEAFTATTGFACCASMAETLAGAEVVLLAVKPQYAAEALKEAASHLTGKLLISIVAGWKILTLQEHAELDRVIRVMPNTPALAGEGMSCYAPADAVSADDQAVAETILSAVGKVRLVAEKQLDADTFGQIRFDRQINGVFLRLPPTGMQKKIMWVRLTGDESPENIFTISTVSTNSLF